MGADIILQSIPKCNLTDKRRDRLHKLIESLELEQLDPGEYYGDDSEIVDRLKQSVTWLQTADNRRDVATCKWPGMTYPVLISGGLSWGDEPTEACTELSLLSRCDPVWNQILQWAEKDAL